MSEDWREQEPLDKAVEMAARTVRAAGQAEKLAHSIQAAHTAAGAAKTGAAASGTAVGTALGGPLGVVIGVLVTSKTFWKVVGSILLAILLFLYIIVNSVSIIFNYLGFENADSYISQARTAECQNMKKQIETLFTKEPDFKREIYDLIEENRDVILNQIDDDFTDKKDGYDGYEVEDEYESVLKPNLSQYLAVLMEENWNGSQIVGFNGYGAGAEYGCSLTSEFDAYFAEAAATYQVSEGLLKAIGKAESDFDPNAVSSAGAIGVMQLMPGTAVNLGVADPYNPKQNIMGGAKYIAELLRTFSAYSNGLSLAVAGYNAGPNAVKKAGYRIPQNGETPAYVEKVLGYLTLPGEEGEGLRTNTEAVSKTLLKAIVEEKGNTFFGWVQTGTHTETTGSEEEEEELEIVDYAVVVKLNSELTALPTDYNFRFVMNQTGFNNILKLFQLMQGGVDTIQDLLFKAVSWKDYILGFGASEDVYTSDIQTGGDTITYESVKGCVESVVYYNQGEEPWASLPYGNSNIRQAGCGPTALAIVISTLGGQTVTPQMTAKYAMDHGEYVAGLGTSHAFPTNAAKNWGMPVERVTRNRMDYVVSELKKGKLAVVICAENTISGSSGHYIVLTGVTADGYITIADPGSRSRTGNIYSPSTIQSYARSLSDGSIWVIGE